jgi:hypothetical protein
VFFSKRVLHLTQTVSGTLPASYPEVNVKVKIKFTLEQAAKTQRGSRGTALFFL